MSRVDETHYAVTFLAASSDAANGNSTAASDAVNVLIAIDVDDPPLFVAAHSEENGDAARGDPRVLVRGPERRQITFEAGLTQFYQLLSTLEEAEAALDAAARGDDGTPNSFPKFMHAGGHLDALTAHTGDLTAALAQRPLDAGLCLDRIHQVRATIRRFRGGRRLSRQQQESDATNDGEDMASPVPTCPEPLVESIPTLFGFMIACHNFHDDQFRTLENLIATLCFCIFTWLPAPLPNVIQTCIRTHFCFLCHASRLQLDNIRRGAVVVRGVPPAAALLNGDALLSCHDDYVWVAQEAFGKMEGSVLAAWFAQYSKEPQSERFLDAMQTSVVETALFTSLKVFEMHFGALLDLDAKERRIFPLPSLRVAVESNPPRRDLAFPLDVIDRFTRLGQMAVSATQLPFLSVTGYIAATRIFSCFIHALFFVMAGLTPASRRFSEGGDRAFGQLWTIMGQLGERLAFHFRVAPQFAPQLMRLGLMLAALDSLSLECVEAVVPAMPRDLIRVAKSFVCTAETLDPADVERALTLGLVELYEHTLVAKIRFISVNPSLHFIFRACFDLVLVSQKTLGDGSGSGLVLPSPSMTKHQVLSASMTSKAVRSSAMSSQPEAIFKAYQSALRVASWIRENMDGETQSVDESASVAISDDAHTVDHALSKSAAAANAPRHRNVAQSRRQSLWHLAAYFAKQASKNIGMRQLLRPCQEGRVNDVDASTVPNDDANNTKQLTWWDYATWANLSNSQHSGGTDITTRTTTRRASAAKFVEQRLMQAIRPIGSLAASLRFFDDLIALCLKASGSGEMAAVYCENYVAVLSATALPPSIVAHVLVSGAKLFVHAGRPADAVRLGTQAQSITRVVACDMPYLTWVTGALADISVAA